MAYITKEEVKTIRTGLKKRFPSMKFSVRLKDSQMVNVSVVRCTEKDFGRLGAVQDSSLTYSEKPLAMAIMGIINIGNFDDSDPQTDYHSVGFYVDLRLGTYDKDCIVA